MTTISQSRLIVLSAIFMVLLLNPNFFTQVYALYPLTFKNSLFIASLALLLGAVIVLLLALVSYRYTIKPVLILVFITSSLTSYFMHSYNVVIDDGMIRNSVTTNLSESMDLFSMKLLVFLALFGLLPGWLVYRATLTSLPWRSALVSRLRLIGSTFIVILAALLLFGDFYASFFREHKTVRYYANPVFPVYSTFRYVSNLLEPLPGEIKHIGLDAHRPNEDAQRELVVLVLGETARADRFSLGGYSKKTNPRLEAIAQNEALYYFANFWSCGTATATSVPCMFSRLGQADYNDADIKRTENLIDVLNHANTNILWLDNNSDSKGVALRVPYVDYRIPQNNPVCDEECRDIGMLSHLQEYIDRQKQGDIFIVLHQMGNHGPAYYKRYPKDFEKFTPVCRTNQLEQCSQQEIDNAYDNAILYTDYFLSEVIALLKRNTPSFETAMLYVSDHGESLGEKGVYLHGLPYMFAPDVQKHVPFLFWFGKSYDPDEIDFTQFSQKRSQRFSHDNLFHTLLGMFETETPLYEASMDLIARKQNIALHSPANP